MLPSIRAPFATVAGLAGVSAAAFLAYRFHFNLASTVLLQLLVVVIVAFRAGFWHATLVSVFANIIVAYFIVPPAFSFAIADSENWVSLVVFEFTALVVSRLSTRAQLQAETAARRQSEIEKLYEFSCELLLLDRCGTPGPQIVLLIERLFGATAVGLSDLSTGRVDLAGSHDSKFQQLVSDETPAGQPQDQNHTAPPAWVKTMSVAGKPAARLAVRGSQITQITVNALASLASVALERSWSFEKESRAEAERQTERLRSAVLDALAHEYKTPLTTIRTASSTLLSMRGLADYQEELVSLIDSETEKLDYLTTRLLRTSRLDSPEVRLRLETVDAGDIVREVLLSLKEQLRGHFIRTYGAETRTDINVDRELMAMALCQIIDNATKYSDPGSTIRIQVEGSATGKSISVHSVGPTIPPDQLKRIFDRFYRSPRFKYRAAGTGLGLSVTKKIMEAHHGRVEVHSEFGGNTFSLILPQLSVEMPPAEIDAARVTTGSF